MTLYEYLDLRRQYSSEVTTIMRFWITLTFGLLAAGHAAGTSLGVVGATAAIALYFVFAFLNGYTIARFTRLLTTMDRMQFETSPDQQQLLINTRGNVVRDMRWAMMSVIAVGSSGAALFVLYRAGLLS